MMQICQVQKLWDQTAEGSSSQEVVEEAADESFHRPWKRRHQGALPLEAVEAGAGGSGAGKWEDARGLGEQPG